MKQFGRANKSMNKTKGMNNKKTSSTTKPMKKGTNDIKYLENKAFLDAEDREIEYLSDKLNIKSDKDKNKLKKEYMKEDGYDEDFVNFLDDLDNILDKPVPKDFKLDDDEDNDYQEGYNANDISIVDSNDDESDMDNYKKSSKNNKRNLDNESEDDDSIEDDSIEDDFNDYKKKNKKENKKNKKQIDDDDDEDIDSDEAYGSETEDTMFKEGMFKHIVEDDENSSKNKKLNKNMPMNKKQHKINEEEEEDDDDNNNDDEEEDNDDNEDDALLLATSEEEEEEEDNNNDDDDDGGDDDDEEEEEESNKTQQTTIDNDYIMINNEKVLVPKTDIYGKPLSGQEEIQKNYTNKYVPPHLRNKLQSNTTNETTPTTTGIEKKKVDLLAISNKEQIEIKKILVSNINKLSLDNFLTVCQSIVNACKEYPKNSIKVVLCDLIIQYSTNPTKLISTFIRLYAGILVAVGNTMGGDINAYCVETITNKYLDLYKHTLEEKSDSNAFEYTKNVHNIYLLLQFLYIYDLYTYDLLADIIEEQATNFTTLDIELIDVMCSFTGYKLRKDTPERLKDIILLLQKKSKEKGYNKNDVNEKNMRIKLMLDHIYELKNNKQSTSIQEDIENTNTIKRLLKRTYTSQASLRISLNDIKNVATNGRWWILGAQYGQKEITANKYNQGNQSKKENINTIISNCDPKLLVIAKKMNMNTDIRKCILIILLTSKDFVEAYERLNKLNLKDLQQREAIKVLMECASREKTFNPYYGLLAVQLCKYNSSNRYTFQVSFWDFLADINSYTTLKITNTAKLLAFIIQKYTLSLSMFKKIDFSNLSQKSILFFTEFFTSLLLTSSEETIEKILSRIAAGQEQQLVCDGLNLFLKTYMLKQLKESNNNQLYDRVKLISKQLDRLSSSNLFA